jgi:hypothetical protein
MGTAVPNRWDVILGNPDMNVPPLDPFMIESIAERPMGALNPITMTPISPSTATQLNPINGHEQNITGRDDLQYACIFDLDPDSQCSTANQDGCDCNAAEQGYNRPLCQYQGAMDGTQTHAKAYPGVRHLQVLKGYGENAIVASICPKNVMSANPSSDPNYGYNPAVGAIIDRLKEKLLKACLPRPLTEDVDNAVPCKVIEAYLPQMGTPCTCDEAQGRTLLGGDAKIRRAVEGELESKALCGSSTTPACATFCMCEIQQFTGNDLATCKTQPNAQGLYGYCYVSADDDPAVNPEGMYPGAAALVAECPASQRQIITFLGENVPRQRAIAFIACLGDAASADGGT